MQLGGLRTSQIVIIAILGILILIPGGSLIFGSFWSASPGQSGYFTLGNIEKAVESSSPASLPTLLFNTFFFAFVTAIASVMLGITMAYLVVRTNMPFRQVFENLSLLPRAFPILIAAIAWAIILSPNIGVLNVFFREMFGFALFNVYSMIGMIFVLTLYEGPVVFLIAINAFRLMDTSLEEASLVCGSGGLRTFFRITLPMIRPLMGSTFILVFVIGMITVEIPILIGMPGGVYVLNSAIFFLLREEFTTPQYGAAAALSLVTLVLTFTLLYFYRRSVKVATRYVTLAGKTRATGIYDLGKLRFVAFTLFASYFVLSMVLPTMIITYLSLSEFFIRPSLESFVHLTTEWWSVAFSNVFFQRGLTNSLLLSSTAATLNLFLAFSIGYISIRTGGRLKGYVETFAMLPLSFPSLVFAIGFVWAFIRTPIYATLWILLLFYTISYLPFAIRLLSPLLYQLHHEFEEASWVSGASRLYTIGRIILPLMRGGLFAVWIMVFQAFLREFGGSIILYSFGTEVLSVVLYSQAVEQGRIAVGAVIGVVILTISLGLYVLVRRYSKVTI